MTDLRMTYKRLRDYSLRDPVRNPAFLSWIRSQPCGRCGCSAPSDPHHIFGSSVSLKSSDIFTIPLCRACHDAHDQDPEMIEVWAKTAERWIRGVLG
jgi:hypothetical protein